MNVNQIEHQLRNAPHRVDREREVRLGEVLKERKRAALRRGDQPEAKLVWIHEQILHIQCTYLMAFYQLKEESYFDGWRSLERTLIALHHLKRHLPIESDEYKLSFIDQCVPQFQSIFPYRMYGSSEFVINEKECSICGKVISIRNPCGHRVGEIYDGELCGRKITQATLIASSLTPYPAHKYAVLFLIDPDTGQTQDTHNYSVVRYLLRRLSSPFDAWDVRLTKRRHPHTRFKDIQPNAACPCESGQKCKECCLRESGVLRPHYQFAFSVPPPKELQNIEYAD